MQEKKEIIINLLDSLNFSPPGGKYQFFWNSENRYSLSGSIGFEFFIDFDKQNIASIQALKCYRDYLAGYSISEVSSLLHNFFESIISDIGTNVLSFPKGQGKTVLDVTHSSKYCDLAKKLDNFIKGNAIKSVYLMPVNGFSCPKPLITCSISWVPGNFNLIQLTNPLAIHPFDVKSSYFPPINDMKVTYHKLMKDDSWFVCHASNESESESMFKRMVGALSVIMEYPNSRIITGRKMINGRACFRHDGTCSFNNRNSLVPAVGLPIEIKKDMIDVFYCLMQGNSDNVRIQVALECLADGWGNTSRISFINNSIAMDALFGIAGNIRGSILNGVEDHASAVSDAKNKYELILKIRNCLLHGEHPTVEICPHYLEFFEKYRSNPVDEQILIINACLLNLAGETANNRESYSGQQHINIR